MPPFCHRLLFFLCFHALGIVVKWEIDSRIRKDKQRVFLDLIKQKYFPGVFGNDVVWTLFCDDADLISWKTKENKLYSRFVDGEPAIISVKRWATAGHINFCYYSPPIKRAQQIFTRFDGLKFHIWHEGFMPEYESYHIPQVVEDDWRKLL